MDEMDKQTKRFIYYCGCLSIVLIVNENRKVWLLFLFFRLNKKPI
jgi:hypothetical protein